MWDRWSGGGSCLTHLCFVDAGAGAEGDGGGPAGHQRRETGTQLLVGLLLMAWLNPASPRQTTTPDE